MPVTVDPQELRHALSSAHDINYIRDLEDGSRQFVLDGPKNARLEFTDDDLANIHPAHGAFLKDLLHFRNRPYSPDLIDSTLFHLEDTSPTLFNIGLTPDNHLCWAHLQRFLEIAVYDDLVNLGLSRIVQLTPEEPALYYSKLTYVWRTIAYMDEHYPHWQERMHLAETLGLSAHETANFAMNYKQGLGSTMPLPTDTLLSY